MFLFNKKQPAKPAPAAPKPASQTVSAPSNPDDFFKNMGRRREQPKVVKEIETPEVTGLREAPLAAPGSTIKNVIADELAAENLADKTLYDDSFVHGDINEVVTGGMDVDAAFEQEAVMKAQKLAEPEKPKIMVDPDDFFKDMGRRKKRRDDEPIESPEITGLREAPEPPPVSAISGLEADTSAAENLRDKTVFDDSFVHGDINEIDITKLDMSSLRE